MSTDTKDALQKLNDRSYEQLSFYRSVVQYSKESTDSKKSSATKPEASKATESKKKK